MSKKINYIIKKIFNRSRGMTLLEVMVSVTMLMVIIISVMNFYINSINTIRYVELKEIALSLAQQEMEQLKIISFNELTSGTDKKNIFKYNTEFKCKLEIVEIDVRVKEITIIIYHEQEKLIVLKNRIFE